MCWAKIILSSGLAHHVTHPARGHHHRTAASWGAVHELLPISGRSCMCQQGANCPSECLNSQGYRGHLYSCRLSLGKPLSSTVSVLLTQNIGSNLDWLECCPRA